MASPRPLPPPDRPPHAGPSLAGRALRWRPALRARGIDRRVAAILLLSFVPLAFAVLAMAETRRIARQSIAAPATPATRAFRPDQDDPMLPLLAAFAAALPPGAHLAQVNSQDGLTVIVETTEPDRLREALAADTALPRLRTIGEAALPDGGYRVTMEASR